MEEKMKELVELKPLLIRLKLNGISDTLESTISNAVNEKWSFTQLLLELLSKEIDRREHKKVCLLLSKSGLDPQKTFELFDFNFNKTIVEPVIKELALCNFIERKENVFFVGPSGVGKTHLSNAIGHEACRRNYETVCGRAHSLMEWLHSGKGDGTFPKKLALLCNVHLLILDDFGLIKMNEIFQNYLYEIICERYEKFSTIITSNRDFGEWVSVFDNPLLASAAMDRLVHKAIKITITGESYRTCQFKKKQKDIFKDEQNVV
jgi:DNA replication protein DnaC